MSVANKPSGVECGRWYVSLAWKLSHLTPRRSDILPAVASRSDTGAQTWMLLSLISCSRERLDSAKKWRFYFTAALEAIKHCLNSLLFLYLGARPLEICARKGERGDYHLVFLLCFPFG